jgi:hypothetical protein
MKKSFLIKSILVILTIPLLTGCANGNEVSNSIADKSTSTSTANTDDSTTKEVTGDNMKNLVSGKFTGESSSSDTNKVKASFILDNGNELIEYEFTNNTGKDIDMCMNDFYSYREPLTDVFPLAVRVSDIPNNKIVRFYVIVEDKYYEHVTDIPPYTGKEDSPATGWGHIYNRIASGQTIKVKGHIIDTGMWSENIYNSELFKPISSLPEGDYIAEIFLFDNDGDTYDFVTPLILDKHESAVFIRFTIP